MNTICAYCGKEVKDTCLTFKGLTYHALQGMSDGRLIYVNRGKSCFDLSDMGRVSLVGQHPQVIMTPQETPPANL